MTSGFFDDDQPVFDPDGRYLYYRTKRWFDAIYSEFEPTWIYANGQALMAVPLRKDVPSPLAPRNDEEPVGQQKSEGGSQKSEDKTPKPEEKPKTEVAAVETAIKGTKPDAAKPAENKPGTPTVNLSDRKPVPLLG